MQKYEQSLTLRGIDDVTALSLCYEAMEHLQLNILPAGADRLTATTAAVWDAECRKIQCRIEGDELFISCEMLDSKVADMGEINKEYVHTFIHVFYQVRSTIDPETIRKNKEAIRALQNIPPGSAEQKLPEKGKMRYAIHLPARDLYITYVIMALNILVFFAMTLDGAGLIDPNPLVHIRWGSNFSPYTLTGDWWRLLSSTFIHFGIIHLGMNMFCLYSAGVYLEPMLGRARYLTAYLCTGIIASLVSLWWHTGEINSAGASGAVFGVYGVFLALLTSNLIPKEVKNSLLQNILIFVVYNLVFGMEGRIDNAAHTGGLLSGVAIGYLYVYDLKDQLQERRSIWIIPAIMLITVTLAFGYLHQNKLPVSERKTIINKIRVTYFPDNDEFIRRMGEFDQIHTNITEIIYNTTWPEEDLLSKIDNVGLPGLKRAEQIMRSTDNYFISPGSHEMAAKLIRYIRLRQSELLLRRQMIQTKKTDSLILHLKDIRKKADAVFEAAMKP